MQPISYLNYDTKKCSHWNNSTPAENTVKHFPYTCSIYPVPPEPAFAKDF